MSASSFYRTTATLLLVTGLAACGTPGNQNTTQESPTVPASPAKHDSAAATLNAPAPDASATSTPATDVPGARPTAPHFAGSGR